MMGHALKILIVEDHLLIARQLDMIVTAAGHHVVGTALNAAQACTLAESTRPDIVFLDINLAGGASGLDVAGVIAETCQAYVIFTTANRRRLPPDCCGAVGVVEKPFTRAGLVSALHFVVSRINESEATVAAPHSLLLSPLFEARWQAGNR